ncbi:MAG: hypothetical protein EP343_31600 [Deltaproteobacteria bacterium]|nr:MAG: hypothetical protein EP343_31600 [Deltaproteobacteria bacterium]
MDEILYVLKVNDDPTLQKQVAQRLCLQKSPEYVRVSAVFPLSNYGYPEDAAGTVLLVNSRGIMIGVPQRPEVPRDFVPWSNIAYFADAADLGPTHSE